jgi:hypothetical protein
MAKLPSSGVVLTLDDSGGTPRIVTSFVLTIGGLKITNETIESTPFGAGWRETLATGIRKGEKITLTGLVDTTANTGTFATMIPTTADAVPGFTRSLKCNMGGGNGTVFNCEVVLESGVVEPKIGLATYQAELQPTGACTWDNS